MEGKFFLSFDDSKLHVYECDNVRAPRGVVQIIHGMGEHAGRYSNVVEFLNKHGFIVFISDHRAHGKTAKTLSDIGIYSGDIFYDTIKDQIYISEYLLDKYDLPLIVLGHSFGSFIAQRYSQLYNRHEALILSGTSFFRYNPATCVGKYLATIGALKESKNRPAKLIGALTFKQYNKKFADNNWLTSDKDEQQKQRIDRLCNRPFSNNFYKYFFSGMLDIYNKKNISKIKQNLPILILSGQMDPLHKNGARLEKLQAFYKQYGAKKIQAKLYKDARHEVLNEKSRQTVYADILHFIENNVTLETPEPAKKEKEKKQK